MAEFTTLREDVQDITRQILEIQYADEQRKVKEEDEIIVDTVRNVRGVDKRYDYTLEQLAEIIGIGDAPHPAKAAGNIYYKAIEKFTKHQYILLQFEKAKKLGFTTEEAEEYAALQYSLEIQSGNNLTSVVRGMING